MYSAGQLFRTPEVVEYGSSMFTFIFVFFFPRTPIVTFAVWTRTAAKGRRWCSATVTWRKCTTTARYAKWRSPGCWPANAWYSVSPSARRVSVRCRVDGLSAMFLQGKESVYALTLENNNGTFEVTPAVIDRRGRFTVMVRNNRLLDFESRPSVRFEVGHGFFFFNNDSRARFVGRTGDSRLRPVVVHVRDHYSPWNRW